MSYRASCKMAKEVGVPCYKIIFLGEPGVGMTTFVLRVARGRFVSTKESPSRSAACDNRVVHKMEIDGESIQVWLDEPAGAERFRSITTSFYRDADAVILMYSVSDPYTFEGLEYIASVAKDHLLEHNITWALIGNKCDEKVEIEDLEDKVAVLSQRLVGSEELSRLHFHVSAKTGEGVVDALYKIAQKIHEQGPRDGRRCHSSGLSVRDKQPSTQSNCCD